MIRSLYTAATGMDAQQLRMDVIANNLSNASTTGFKRARPEFEDLFSETLRHAGSADPRGGGDPTPLQIGMGVRTGTTARSFAQGDLTNTQNPLDLAIAGNGFFRVQRIAGDIAYTRAGNFRVDANGRMVTAHGELLDPAITIPPEATAVTIAQDGTVTATVPGSTAPTSLGQILLANFANPAGLESIGNNLFVATVASGDAQQVKPADLGAATLAQGSLESANVQVAQEMIDMISAQRAYELNSKVIQTADQMLQRLTTIR